MKDRITQGLIAIGVIGILALLIANIVTVVVTLQNPNRSQPQIASEVGQGSGAVVLHLQPRAHLAIIPVQEPVAAPKKTPLKPTATTQPKTETKSDKPETVQEEPHFFERTGLLQSGGS